MSIASSHWWNLSYLTREISHYGTLLPLVARLTLWFFVTDFYNIPHALSK